jgi:hypothetical protein
MGRQRPRPWPNAADLIGSPMPGGGVRMSLEATFVIVMAAAFAIGASPG